MESVLRGATVYLVLMVIFRLSGRRTLAQMTPFDFVLLLIVAETTQQALLGDDFSLTNSVLLILTLFMADIGLSYVKKFLPPLARLLDGTPTVLVSDGRIDRDALSRARIDLDDILAAARAQHGLERLDQVKSAVLEIGGTISIIPRQQG
ncbi:MAG: DUF421 domain-containing protein [Reyranellaceae bacterium]